MSALHGFADDTPPAVRRRVAVVLALAVLGISSSAVLVRVMEGIGPVALAAWRCLGSALLLAPGIAAGARRLERRDVVGMIAAGALLGGHFAVWFASLAHTTVMRSTVLVALVPVWTALAEWALWGTRPTRRLLIGVALALLGSAMMSRDGLSGGSLLGDGLALFAGALWAAYFLIGRQIRQRVEITAYMGGVCAAATALLFPVAVAIGEPLWGWPGRTWALVALAILGPQLMGHQGASYAVKYLPAAVVSTVMLLEPVGATLLAMAVLGEIPPPQAAIGALFVLLGVGATVAPLRG